jgi:hypothetical protein
VPKSPAIGNQQWLDSAADFRVADAMRQQCGADLIRMQLVMRRSTAAVSSLDYILVGCGRVQGLRRPSSTVKQRAALDLLPRLVLLALVPLTWQPCHQALSCIIVHHVLAVMCAKG